MNNELKDNDIWSFVIADVKKSALFTAYKYYKDVKFKVADLEGRYTKLLQEHFETSLEKWNRKKKGVDFSNEVASNNNKGEGWYEDAKDDNGEKIKGYKKLTQKGIIDAYKMENEIKEQFGLKEYVEFELKGKENASAISIRSLVEKIKSGKDAKIPTFQRQYVWNYDKVAPLYLSLLKNFPIGSMLFWQTEESEELSTNQDDENYEIKDFEILDGLQRTFSLTLLDNNPYAYLNYELYKFVVEKKLNNVVHLKEGKFNSYMDDWKHLLDNREKHWSDKTESEMIKIFENNFQIKLVLKYLRESWVKISKSFKIPYILLNNEYERTEAADIFNIINSHGVELNNFEINASTWSKTRIDLENELDEEHFLVKWVEDKYISYRNKIQIKENVISTPIGEKIDYKLIEPADFIYAVFENAIDENKHLLREVFFKDKKLKNNALEPMLTIFLILLKMNDQSDARSSNYNNLLPELGRELNATIKNQSDINNLVKKLTEAADVVETALLSFKKMIYNSSDKLAFNIPTSLMSLIINIAIKEKENENVIKNLKYIFIIQYLDGSYGSGSTKNAWKELNNEEYIDVTKKKTNKFIESWIENKVEQSKIESSYDYKFVLILALTFDNFVKYDGDAIEESDNKYNVDHIIPHSLFKVDASNKINKNYFNTFYNLQLLPKNINSDKKDKIDSSNKKYYTSNYLLVDECDKDEYDVYKKKFNSLIEKVKNEMSASYKSNEKRCKKIDSPNYESFIELIELQKNFYKRLMKNGLL